jgi:hypothetical protein
MKSKRFTDEQVIKILQEAESRTSGSVSIAEINNRMLIHVIASAIRNANTELPRQTTGRGSARKLIRGSAKERLEP